MAVIENILKFDVGELKPKDDKRLRASCTFFPVEGRKVMVYRPKASGGLWVPRGILSEVPTYVRIVDRRSFPKLEKFEPNIELDFHSSEHNGKKFYGQADCIAAMREHRQGLIHRQPGTGKTNIALYFIATVGTRTLVIVHTEDILNQWLKYARELIPDIPLGIIRQSSNEVEQLTVATLQTLHKREFPPEWWRQFGCTIADEVHHYAANTFDSVIGNVTSRYLFGMSASQTRADHMEPLVRMKFGSVIHEQKFGSPIPVTVFKIKTNFRAGAAISGPMWLRRKRWQGMIKRLIENPGRNKLIAKRVSRFLDEDRSTLVLSRRIEHLQLIQAELEKRGHDSVILAAKLVKKPERKELVEQFRSGKIKCVLATQLADEALDIPRLSCVALTFPGKHTDLILQQVGRALREHKSKHDAVVLDFVDINVKSLRSQYHGRRRFYLHSGFTIRGDGLRGRMNGKVKKAQAVVMGRIR